MDNTEKKRIKILNYRTNQGIAPKPENIVHGEIAIGYKKDNEAIYIKNSTDEIVDFTPISIINITYNELKELRNNSKLKPSQYYRITDFVTTVANDPEAQSAGHKFDLIILATDKNKLQEECYAIQHEGDTYFANCNLAAWKIWYCLDNDNTKYAWADTVNGKGVIYRMIDEWQNDCPYDFKNVQFKRYWANGINTAKPGESKNIILQGYYGTSSNTDIFTEGIDTNDYLFLFTFTRLNNIVGDYGKGSVIQSNVLDESIQTEGFDIDVGDDKLNKPTAYNFHNRCRNNILKPTETGLRVDTKEYMALVLLNNVFITVKDDKLEAYQPPFDNTLGVSCVNNTFGNNFNSNSFGNNCCHNSFGDNCEHNSFGNKCNRNTFGDGCSRNSFGNDCYSNRFGDYCYSNQFGDGCYNNSFGDGCFENSFGNECSSNSFGNNCKDNSFGNVCKDNSFGNNCKDNSFGNVCVNNSFGNECNSNSFGNVCDNNSFRDGCFENSFGDSFRDNSFGNRCSDNSFWGNCHDNSFGDECVGNSFGNDCARNSFGNRCRGNSFENGCSGNSFGHYCVANSFGSNCVGNSFGNYFQYNALGNDVRYVGITTEKIYHTQVLNGTKGTRANKLTLEFTPEAAYSQFAGFTSDGVLKIWVEADDIINITYNELKELRNNSKLKPSQYYRITDFVTTVANDPEAQSAGHKFDLIILATDKNKLQEECYAIQHEGDTYFANCNLAAWKIWYCLDNDNTKYAWADTVNGKGVIYRMIDEWQNDCPYDFKNVQFKRYWANGINTAKPGESKNIILQGYYGTSSNTDIFTEGIDTNDYLFLFTFTRLNNISKDYVTGSVTQSNVLDESIQTEGFDIDAENDKLNSRCRNNIFKPTEADLVVDTKEYMTFILLNNVFITVKDDKLEAYQPPFDNTLGVSCVNNTFGSNTYGLLFLSSCDSNSFGNDCSFNRFGDGCSRNSFGSYCSSNRFGGGCNRNSFGNDCYSNRFGNYCHSNQFGYGCTSNSFGNYCSSNRFGNSCDQNSFGNDCYSNQFGDGCYNNSFGNYCYNSFGNSCARNSFGNDCRNNSFGNYCSSNRFGNSCTQNTFGNYFQYNALGNDVQDVKITTEKIYHTQVLNGTKGTLANKLTIAFTPEAAYSQFAGTAPDGTLMVWVPTSNAIEPVQGNKQYNDY